ncbi:TspO/MBR family protein [Stenomitos frigidus]|uniref:TspO protein n=1 Tax=Stenomitos frigidus ULC18 TaxID=2107698 RepID=A0A2T1EGJ4_9CYAN|nr:TspO/MBR family protein [Stenomitos frigidus]PSB31877.1 TspO protein [Stenomitos frigidus ULC18]
MIKSWMVIGGVAFLIAFASSILRPKDVKWFSRLQRPLWLTFEALIPVIWTFILICGAWSAYIVWERDPGTSNTWFLMGAYAVLEVAIVLYSPVTLWLRSLKAGTIVGGVGVVIGLVLTLVVWQSSGWAALLLVPYLLWSPIGTYTTWEMGKLNPESA